MKKMVAMVAFATALMVGASAMAASVNIFVRESPTHVWTIGATAEVNNGQIALFVDGFSGMTLAPLSQISALDSPFSPQATGGATLQITSAAGSNLIPVGVSEILLATLTGQGVQGAGCSVGGGVPNCGINSGDDAFGYTALDQALTGTLDYSLTIIPTPPPVPEPTTMVLLGLGLAALATVRRSA
jgi:hypothetical protein